MPKITNFKNESESDLRRQINGSRQDLTIGGLGAPDHVAIFKHRIKSVSGAGDQAWEKIENPYVAGGNYELQK